MHKHQYLYGLSNPSMPGLLKVGKTTTHPTQRMAELHSTGVPTPFVLEFSLIVRDCGYCERQAHQLLQKYRVSGKREFFQVSVKDALTKILPHISGYQIEYCRNAHGLAAIEKHIEDIKDTQERRLRATAIRNALQNARFQAEKAERRRKIEEQISQLESELQRLGPKPPSAKTDLLPTLLMLCFLPLPYGWAIWLTALSVFKGKPAGIACTSLILIGAVIYKQSRKRESERCQEMQPYYALDKRIAELRHELYISQ